MCIRDSPKPWLQQCQKDIGTLSAQLTGVEGEILALPDEDAALLTNVTSMQKALSDLEYEIGRRLYLLEDTTRTSHFEPTVKLPKISVPTFDGDVLNWAMFWEQFETTIHSNEKLHDAQKLACLRDAVASGPAKSVIQGLAHSAGNYQEAVKCLSLIHI